MSFKNLLNKLILENEAGFDNIVFKEDGIYFKYSPKKPDGKKYTGEFYDETIIEEDDDLLKFIFVIGMGADKDALKNFAKFLDEKNLTSKIIKDLKKSDISVALLYVFSETEWVQDESYDIIKDLLSDITDLPDEYLLSIEDGLLREAFYVENNAITAPEIITSVKQMLNSIRTALDIVFLVDAQQGGKYILWNIIADKIKEKIRKELTVARDEFYDEYKHF